MTIDTEETLPSMRGNALIEKSSNELQRVMDAKAQILDKPHSWRRGDTLTAEIKHADGLFWSNGKKTNKRTKQPFMDLHIGLVSPRNTQTRHNVC